MLALILNIALNAPALFEKLYKLYQQYKAAGVTHVTEAQVDTDLAGLDADIENYDKA